MTDMSEVMEKTFSSVSGFIMNSLGSRNMDVSPGFHNLIRSIRKARSKTEEEKAIHKELELLKLKLQQPDTSVAKIKEYLVRIMYCEVLGHTASFSYIPAIKLAQQGSLTTKRVGYLATSLFLHENHELILLLVNTIQRDLSSTNMLHNCMALGAVCQLIGPEMIPAVLPLVEDKLTHSKALVRKKAVLALRALYSKAPHMLQNPDALFKQALCDRDEAVTSAALHIHSDLIKENPAAHKQLVRPLVAILRQVAGHKLSSDLEYHGVSAPWTQIRILRMLARLGAGDEYYSNLMYDLLDDIIQQTSALSHNIAYAVQYECLVTVATIHPQQQLLAKAAQCISKFLRSFNYNLRYMGICALSAILKAHPSCAEEHQLTVVDCLDDADDTIRLKTLDLLVRMTSSANVQAICDRLLTHLEGTRDTFVRRDLLAKIVQLAEEYRPSVHWYLDTMTQVLLTGGGLVPGSIVNDIICAISKASGNGDDIGRHALQLYLPHINKKGTPSELIRISCWVLGEFAHLSSAPPASELLSLLCSLMDQRLDDDMRLWVVAALTKVVASSGLVSEGVLGVIETCQKGPAAELRQRACELQRLSEDMPLMKAVLVRPDTPQELQFDWTLSFLDEFVSEALAQGAAPYKPKQQRHAERQQETQVMKPLFSGLNFVPYRSPTPSQTSCTTATSVSTPETRTATKSITSNPSLSSGASGNSAEPRIAESSTGLKLDGVRRVWGQQGYSKTAQSPRTHPEPPAVDGQVPHSPTVTPSSPARDLRQPSVQLSSATAVGRTTASRAPSADSPTEEDHKKRELAKALFGGLHTTMTTNSKKPVERKPETSSKLSMMSPSTGKLQGEKMPSGQTDLLLLSDLDGHSLVTGPLRANPPTVPCRDSSLDRISPERLGHQGADSCLASREEGHLTDVSRTDPNPEVAIPDGGFPRQGKEESDLIGPRTSTGGRHSRHQRSMYDDFKEADLNLKKLESSPQTGCLRPDDRPLAADHTFTEDGVNRLLDIQNDLTLSHSSSQESSHSESLSSSTENNSKESPLHDSAILPETPKMPDSQAEPATTLPPPARPTAELSILDSCPDDFPYHQGHPGPPQDARPQDWEAFPRCRDSTDLCGDATVGVSLYKVWKPDTLGLVFRVANLNPKHGVVELQIKLNVSSNLKVSGPQQDRALSIDRLDPGATTTLVAELGCSSPALHMSLGGEITYKDHTRTSRRLFFSTPLPVSDLLRSLALQTTEFGQLWPSQTRDCKLSTELSAAVSMSKVMTLLTQELHLHLVEIIGNEGIACGSLLGGPPCLLHAKLPVKTSLELWLRSPSQLLTECVARQCREDILMRL